MFECTVRSPPASAKIIGKKEKKMDKSLTDWTGNKSELDFVVQIRISKIMEQFSVNKKTAIKLFCEAMLRSLVISEMDNMINYLVTGEIS